MKTNLTNLKFYSSQGINQNLSKTKEVDFQALKEIDAFIKELINKIQEAHSTTDADKLLAEISEKTTELEKIDHVNFKYNDYNILTTLKVFGEQHVKNLEKLNNMQLSVAPELVSVLEKDNGMYIITKNPGTKDGILKHYHNFVSDNIPKEAKLQAYRDMQKLTKAGLIDDNVYNGKYWYYTPENKILIPIWKNLRPISSKESRKDIMERYYHIIFDK